MYQMRPCNEVAAVRHGHRANGVIRAAAAADYLRQLEQQHLHAVKDGMIATVSII